MSAKHDTAKSKKRILDDHLEIGELLAASSTSKDASEIVANMKRLTQLLGRHFAEEEGELGGLHQSNLERAPRHANSIRSLKEEHRELLQSVRDICDAAEKAEGDVPELRERSSALKTRFHAHEARETEIFVDSVWTDIGTKD